MRVERLRSRTRDELVGNGDEFDVGTDKRTRTTNRLKAIDKAQKPLKTGYFTVFDIAYDIMPNLHRKCTHVDYTGHLNFHVTCNMHWLSAA